MSGVDNTSQFNITVGEFKGSLETLLEMVQKRKVHISDISLAQVADDYIDFVRSLGQLPRGQTAEFIVVAATLLLIKSKSLLPNLKLSADEEESIKDLEDRLGLYKIYKEAADRLQEDIKTANSLHKPKDFEILQRIFAPPKDLSIESLSTVMQGVLSHLQPKDIKPKAQISEPVNIADVMTNLLARVEGGMQSSFKEMSGVGRQEVLINFLALLELVKEGALLAEQEGAYGEILLNT